MSSPCMRANGPAPADSHSPEMRATSSSSCSDENDSHNSRAPMKNVSRERMKAEKAFLHQKVVELERELTHVLAKKALARCAKPASAWKGLAKRQSVRRHQAEEENARLKSRLLHQLQVAKSLETVLRNRAATFLEDVSDSASQNPLTKYSLNDLDALHEQCMDEIDQVYAQADSILNDPNWSANSAGSPVRRSTVISQQDNGFEKLLVDLRTTSYVPFSFEKVCRATWGAITTEYVRQNRLIHQTTCTDEEYMSKFWLTNTGIVEHQFSATMTMRKFQEENRVVIVWRSLDLKETPAGSSLYGDETGWLAIERSLDPVIGKPTDDTSTVRMCSRYVPVWDGSPEAKQLKLPLIDAEEGDASPSLISQEALEAVGEFTNHILMGTEADIASITEAIENILLDEAIGSADEDLQLMVQELEVLEGSNPMGARPLLGAGDGTPDVIL